MNQKTPVGVSPMMAALQTQIVVITFAVYKRVQYATIRNSRTEEGVYQPLIPNHCNNFSKVWPFERRGGIAKGYWMPP